MCLRITFEMASPVMFDGEPLHLDGIFAHYANGDQRGEFPNLPLAIHGHDGMRWYRASAWWPDHARGDVSYPWFWSKKWDHDNEDMLDTSKAKCVTLTNARHKEYKVPVQIVSVPSIVYHCVGDYVHVRQIARRVRMIGHKVGQGFGRVGRVLVQHVRDEVDPREWSLDWRRDDGSPARNIPAEWWTDRTGSPPAHTRMAALHAPYWRRIGDGVVPCAGLTM